MLHADDVGIVSRSPRVRGDDDGDRDCVCGVRLFASVTKTEIIRLETKMGGGVPFTVTATGQVCKETDGFVYLGGSTSTNRHLSVEVMRRVQRACGRASGGIRW